jgi:hypothetical protein
MAITLFSGVTTQSTRLTDSAGTDFFVKQNIGFPEFQTKCMVF